MKKFTLPLAAFACVAAVGIASPRAMAQDHTAQPTKAADHPSAKTAEHSTGTEHAAGAEHAAAPEPKVIPGLDEGLVSGVASLVVFGLAFAILATKVWPKILGGLKDRENKIRDEIQSAEAARQEAKDALEQYQKSLADSRAQAAKMLETTRAQQAQLAADLKAKADVELNQMRERAIKDIESAKRAAVSEIYNHAGQLAAAMAGKILRRSVNSEDTQRLVEESLQQLQASHN